MIWYSHVNEDNAVEEEIAARGGFARIFCVAGSGERVISLLGAPTVREIHAIDLNDDAMHMLSLKLAALRHLSAEEYLCFSGVEDASASDRRRYWSNVMTSLESDTREFWAARTRDIERGFMNAGHLERYLSRIRPAIRAYLGSGFEECWNVPPQNFDRFPWRRWEALCRVFSWRWVYRVTGTRDPAFVSAGAECGVIGEALRRTLKDHGVPDSCMWHLVFNGHLRSMRASAIPKSTQREWLVACHDALATRRTTVRVHVADLLEYLRAQPPANLADALVSASDILSFCDFSYVLRLVDVLEGRHNTLVIRSFLKNGLGPAEIEALKRRCESVVDWSSRERTRMYRVYELRV